MNEQMTLKCLGRGILFFFLTKTENFGILLIQANKNLNISNGRGFRP